MLTDYQTRLNELYNKLLRIQPKRCEAEYVDVYGHQRKTQYNLCKINGVRYVPARDVAYQLTERRKMNISHGLIKEEDMPYFFVEGQGRNESFVYVNIDMLAERNNLAQLIGRDGYYLSQGNAVIYHALKEPIDDVAIDKEEYDRCQQAYRDIQKLRKEKKAFDELQKQERELECERRNEERKREHDRQEERTLRELVQQIEDMGWHVTLSFKG